LSGWIVAVFTSTLALFTAAGIVEERRQILRNDTDQARAFVEHVAQMPEFKMPSTFGAAAPHLASIRDLLRAAGADLEMTPRPLRTRTGSAGPRELTTGVLATRQISLSDGVFELAYRKDPGRYREMAARSVTIHVLHGVLALAALVVGTEWILRRRLLAPLARISHQVDHMRSGGGWLTILPQTDSELEALAGAVGRLGPALERQIQQWVEAERRAAVAFMLNVVRSELREPVREVRARASDLEARDLVSPAGKLQLRALVAATNHLTEALAAADRMTFAQQQPPDHDGTPNTEATETS
jgi:HAMP domain-containing protein